MPRLKRCTIPLVIGLALSGSTAAQTAPIDRREGLRVERDTIAWRDEHRRDPLSPDTSAKREYLTFVWRPARQPSSRPPLPLLVFSPGLGVSPTAYDSLLSQIARDGYLVVAVAHTYTTWRVRFPDGRVVRAEDSRLPFNFATHVRIVAEDLVAALNYVTDARTRHDPVFHDADLTRVGVFGHSYGGAASAEACYLDARFKAGMNLDGTVFGSTVTRGVPCPFFLLMSTLPLIDRLRPGTRRFYPDRDQGRLHEEMMFERSPHAYWLTVDDLDHMSFADAAFSPSRLQRFSSLLGARLTAESVRELTTRYARAFFGHFLRGDASPAELRRSPYAFATLRRSAPRARSH